MGEWRIQRSGSALARAVEFDSVPPDVNTTSSRWQSRVAASRSRASSSQRRATRPSACALDGLPASGPSQQRRSASRAHARSGQVAL
jgi:hypothetical protein